MVKTQLASTCCLLVKRLLYDCAMNASDSGAVDESSGTVEEACIVHIPFPTLARYRQDTGSVSKTVHGWGAMQHTGTEQCATSAPSPL